MQCRQVQSGSTCTFHGTPTCSRTLSTADNSRQQVEGLSRKRATDHLFFSNPTLQDPVFLVCVLLIDCRCSLPDRQHVWCAARSARVGGIASYGLCFLANMSSRASSTPLAVLDLLYIITTNFSRICRSSSSTVNGYWLSLANT